MAINKIEYAGSTLLDLSVDTLVSADQLLNTVKAHNRAGIQITGNLVINKYYTGSSEPSTSLGNNGDLYLVVK